MERITATFDAKTAAAIRKAAGRRGVSAFLQEAARERLARLELVQLLDELDAAHGAPSAAEMAEVRREAAAIFPTRAAARPSGRAPRRPRRSKR